MLVIIFTVLTQGPSVPAEDKGNMSVPLWTVNGGVFQAIGVISFGMNHLVIRTLRTYLNLITN